MSCRWCEETIRGNPCVSGKITNICLLCGQKWWCFNSCLGLWQEVSDDFLWECILQEADYPISIDTGEVIGVEREKFIKPSIEVCRPLISFPRYTVKKINGKETSGVQWTGEYDAQNILGYQFFFPLICPVIENWGLFLGFIRAGYIGELKACSNQELREQLEKHFEDSQYIAYIIGTDPEVKWNGKPISFVCEVVMLVDSNLGVIKPKQFSCV